MPPIIQWLSDYSKFMLITILLFRNYSQKIGDLLFPKLFRHNRRKPTFGSGITSENIFENNRFEKRNCQTDNVLEPIQLRIA